MHPRWCTALRPTGLEWNDLTLHVAIVGPRWRSVLGPTAFWTVVVFVSLPLAALWIILLTSLESVDYLHGVIRHRDTKQFFPEEAWSMRCAPRLWLTISQSAQRSATNFAAKLCTTPSWFSLWKSTRCPHVKPYSACKTSPICSLYPIGKGTSFLYVVDGWMDRLYMTLTYIMWTYIILNNFSCYLTTIGWLVGYHHLILQRSFEGCQWGFKVYHDINISYLSILMIVIIINFFSYQNNGLQKKDCI